MGSARGQGQASRARSESPPHRPARQEVHPAEEARHRDRGWAAVNLPRGRLLREPAVQHQRHAVGQRHGLGLVMGHDKHGGPGLLLQVADQRAHLVAQAGVKVRQRFVQKQEVRRQDQRPRQGPALRLPAGKLGRAPVAQAGKLHAVQHRGHAERDLGRRARPASAGRSRRSRPGSGAGKGARSGTPSPRRAGLADGQGSTGRPGGCRRRQAPSARRSAAAAWTCPSRRAQEARSARPQAPSATGRRSPAWTRPDRSSSAGQASARSPQRLARHGRMAARNLPRGDQKDHEAGQDVEDGNRPGEVVSAGAGVGVQGQAAASAPARRRWRASEGTATTRRERRRAPRSAGPAGSRAG